MLGSGAVSRSSKKQNFTSLSTTKAEYISASSVACQAVWLRRLLADKGKEKFDANQLCVIISLLY